MELAPVRRRHHPVRRVLVVGCSLLAAWLFAIALAPALLGLGSDLAQGVEGVHPATVVMTRTVPVDDIRAGDRVSIDGHLHRVLSIAPGVLVTDDLTRVGAPVEVFAQDRPSVDVVSLAVPYVGLPLVGLVGLAGPGEPLRWLSFAVLTGLLLLAALMHRSGAAVARPAPAVPEGVSIG